MKSESDSIHKAHADIFQMENGHLLSKIQKITDQLKMAEEVIEYAAYHYDHEDVTFTEYIVTRDKTSQTEIT